MQKILLILSFLTIFSLISCKKDVNLRQNTIIGKWKLVDGKMYIEDLLSGDITTNRHFANRNKVSSLRYDTTIYSLERIVRDSTIWTFKNSINNSNTGEFWLNNDSLNPYGFNLTNSYMSIIENGTGPQKLGGSSRPITFDEINNNKIYIFIQETYASIDGYNVRYYNRLEFIRLF